MRHGCDLHLKEQYLGEDRNPGEQQYPGDQIFFSLSLSILSVQSSDLRCCYRVLIFETWGCVCGSDLWCGFGFDLGIRFVFVIFDLGICGF